MSERLGLVLRGLALLFGACVAAGGCNLFDRNTHVKETTQVKSDTPDAADTKESPAPDINATTRLSAGRMLENEGNLVGAVEQYREIIKVEPNNVEAYTRLGIACNRLQRYDDALKAFMRAIEIQPDKAYMHNNLGFCYVLRGELPKAEQSFKQALALNPEYKRARMNLGAVLAQTNRTEAAVAEFEKVVPREVAFYDVGLILTSNKRYAAAEEAFKHTLSLNPSSREAKAQLDRLAMLKQRDPTGETSPAVANANAGAAPVGLPIPATQAADDASLAIPMSR